jgi:predicted phage baseplate assembly protein
VAPCAQAKPLTAEGIESCWIRAQATVPLAVVPELAVPEVASLRFSTVLSRARVTQWVGPGAGGVLALSVFKPDAEPAPAGAEITQRTLSGAGGTTLRTLGAGGQTSFAVAAGTTLAFAFGAEPTDEDFLAPLTVDADLAVTLTRRRGLAPDKAIGDEKPVDVTRAFQPLGQAPARGAAFYLACDEVFAKPGARVTLALERPVTASEEADATGGEFEDTVQGAQEYIADFVADLGGAADALAALTTAAGALGQAVPEIVNPGTSTAQWYAIAQAAVAAALAALADAAGRQPQLFSAVTAAQGHLRAVAGGTDPADAVDDALADLGTRHRDVARVGADVAAALAHLAANPGGLQAAADAVTAAVGTGNEGQITAAQAGLAGALAGAGALTAFLTGARPSYLVEDPESFRATVAGRLTGAKTAVDAGVATVRGLADDIATLDPKTLVAGASGNPSPQLEAATIAWEYWDGRRWRELAITGDDEAKNFSASGLIRFDVPDGWEPLAVVNDTRRWLRARLASGSYSHLRLVSWTDATSGVVNFLPVVEPRPPVLDGVEIFFHYTSPSAAPLSALARNDFEWQDATAGLVMPGPGFVPYRPMPDHAPTLYLGFDGTLPADRLGLYVELQEADPDARPLAVTWEGHDGVGWRTLAVEDGTRGLTAHGVVGAIWPGDAAPPGAAVIGATGTSVALADRSAAARFAPGDRVVVRDPRGGEPAVVTAAQGETLTLRDPVSRAYVGGEVVDAPPARFGTPRTWLRARFDATADPPPVALAALAPNATTLSQTEAIAGEVVGSSDGSPRQALFVRRPPVLEGETVEVRELEGARAPVDLPILERELAAAGLAGAARTVRDPRTAEISEVWVRWALRASLGLSGPADRHYTVDRAAGRILFGDGVHGRIPPAAPDDVRADYRTGGGAVGNVVAGQISAMVSAVPASRVANPRPAAGGADGELHDAVLLRGPHVLRHRRMAITAADGADLAHETCQAVARARVLGARDAFGRQQPGSTRVIVVPQVDDPQPVPDPELRRRVRAALAARAPATAAAGIVVVAPDYVPIGADVTVRAMPAAEPGQVRAAVLAELEAFLHPLHGGPDGAGFDFGRAVFLSDIARALEALDGVDVVTAVALTRDGVQQGERVTVGPDQLVCAGPLQVTLAGTEG